MRVALVHDWLTGMRGGERCLEEFLQLYPEADIFTLVHEPGTTTDAIDRRVRGTSWLQRFPRLRRYYRAFLPLFPLLAWSVRVENYDLVISLSHAAAKNVRLVNVRHHVCYCFTPMRYIWDMGPVYLGRWLFLLAFPLVYILRRWDRAGAARVDTFVAISKFVAARIRLFYKRRSYVVYPPVAEKWKNNAPQRTRTRATAPFLYAGALVPYKGVEQIIRVCRKGKFPLLCVGSGPLLNRLKAEAGESVSFKSGLSDSELSECYRGCRALIFPAREDFGIIPIEAMLSGAPVIAGYHGATRESLPALRWWLGEKWDKDRHIGVFFKTRIQKPSWKGWSARGMDYEEQLAESLKHFIQYEEQFCSATACAAGVRFLTPAFRQAWKVVEERVLSGGPIKSDRY